MAGEVERAEEQASENVELAVLAAEGAALAIIAEGMAQAKAGATYADVQIAAGKAQRKAQRMMDAAAAEASGIVADSFSRMERVNVEAAADMYKHRGITEAASAVPRSTVEAAQMQAAETIATTAKGIEIEGRLLTFRQAYVKTVTDAVAAAQAGEAAFTAAVDRAVSQLVDSGLRVAVDAQAAPRVAFASGRTQELYSVVRMHAHDAYMETQMELRDEIGDEVGADGYEVSAHALCAPDHLDIQGQQYTAAEFERMNRGLSRPIGTLNCGHTYFRVIVGISKAAYSRRDLAQMRKSSSERVTFTGVSGKRMTRTRYEATQYQRSIEAKVRQANTKTALAKLAGGDPARFEAQSKAYRKAYGSMCREAGLEPRPDRMRGAL